MVLYCTESDEQGSQDMSVQPWPPSAATPTATS